MKAMRLNDIINELAVWAPPSLQESYDNAGLIVGHPTMEITQAIVCLDSTEEVVDEAIAQGANLIIAHHPIVFKGLKRFNGNTYIERVIAKAIKHDVAIYAIHTNLDNVKHGVNAKIAALLGVTQHDILAPLNNQLLKLKVFVPVNKVNELADALFEVGAGEIGNYSHCSYRIQGKGTFKANNQAKPYVGNKEEIHVEEETKLEVIVPKFLQRRVEQQLYAHHPYEEPAFDWIALQNNTPYGAGIIGDLASPMEVDEFLRKVKAIFKAQSIRYTKPVKSEVNRIAVCGGSGSFLLPAAIRQGADVLLTADFKYHQFFDAEDQLIICDIGHYESEQFTIDLICEFLSKKFPTFAVRSTKVNTNPINYFN